MITINISDQQEKQLREVAREEGKSIEDWARAMILEYLEDLEDLKIAEDRLKALEAGQEDTIPLKDVMNEYDMES